MKRSALLIGLCASLGVVAPALAAHPHPAKANKFQALLVVSFTPCTAPNTTHNPSIAIPACTGPTVTSNGAHAIHFGPKGSGQATLSVVGSTSDVKIVAKMTDVRDVTDMPYNGSLNSFSPIIIT